MRGSQLDQMALASRTQNREQSPYNRQVRRRCTELLAPINKLHGGPQNAIPKGTSLGTRFTTCNLHVASKKTNILKKSQKGIHKTIPNIPKLTSSSNSH